LVTQLKSGGTLHLRLNIATRPIANQYREGKLKSTLKRELKVRETGGVETDGADEYGLCSIALVVGFG
jgi:hypothetical protein